MLSAGGNVFSLDLSNAVEANQKNCKSISKTYFICQADVLNIPFAPNQFDIVVCIGMIQHTPDQLETLKALRQQIKPGGELFIDFYSDSYPLTLSRKVCRFLVLQAPEKQRLMLIKNIVSLIWPIHRLLYLISSNICFGKIRLVRKLYFGFLRISPVVDHNNAYENLSPLLLKEWAILDTHDTLTDHYKHLTTPMEAQRILEESGFIDINISLGGNGIEIRAKTFK